jgi:hypothetical protein
MLLRLPAEPCRRPAVYPGGEARQLLGTRLG